MLWYCWSIVRYRSGSKKARGTIIERQPKTRRKTFGCSLFLGRDENGEPLRKVKRGFTRESEAEQTLRDAILEMQRKPEIERTMPTFRGILQPLAYGMGRARQPA